MGIVIRDIERKDYKKAIAFANVGMHFDWYLDSKFMLWLYGNYFWHSELNDATQVFAAYQEEQFVGVLMASVEGEEKRYRTLRRTVFVKVVEFFQKLLYSGGAGVYEKTNQEMYRKYRETSRPDGQIVFLAADPEAKVKGIGTMLLEELERREEGKELFLYTDNACTWQFYEHRGFACFGEKDVVLEFGEKKVPLKCLLYSKVMGEKKDVQ